MPSYILTEPAPSTTSYIRSGRGGAGNTFRASPQTTSTTITTSRAPASSSPRRFFSGVGGAGNVHKASERPSASAILDDELRRRTAREENSMGHCGIGGAGNVYRRKGSDASSQVSDTSSVSSTGSRSKLWAKMTGKQ
ncbi:uncharacterized protein F5Z01DRAFT_672975 [Emericellopsis atlantica]|uniref:Uncharacterized protein n=1 Tax=Emericellopsis atlantica TaxID=2614577 RepID=A0A9P7ZPE5_9HYPO|nr:uncharacterized protein F5Z01DRAFT_672975 [Emericellopsis atlantica]KAG9255671.1 hypothetical protein F5Z01DRAFT_672975 [Emericellopsis atlantica]